MDVSLSELWEMVDGQGGLVCTADLIWSDLFKYADNIFFSYILQQ